MDWMKIFHNLFIPFLGGLALTLGKLIADRKLLSFDESNDIALDMVLLAVGALGAFYIKGTSIEATLDAGVVDAFLATTLLYLRHTRKLLANSDGSLPLDHSPPRNLSIATGLHRNFMDDQSLLRDKL